VQVIVWKHTRLRNVLIIIYTCPLTGQVCCSYTGVVCAGGSDAPVESPQPLLGIYDCIYRPADGNRRETSQQFKLVELHTLCLGFVQRLRFHLRSDKIVEAVLF